MGSDGKSKKELRQEECRRLGIKFTQRDTIKTLDEKIAAKKGGVSSSAPRARVQTRTRSGSARTSATRARSAPLSRAAPTTRMRVDMRDYDPQPMRRTTSADILAVAAVIFLGLLAFMATPNGKHGPTSSVTPVVIVAQA